MGQQDVVELHLPLIGVRVIENAYMVGTGRYAIDRDKDVIYVPSLYGFIFTMQGVSDVAIENCIRIAMSRVDRAIYMAWEHEYNQARIKKFQGMVAETLNKLEKIAFGE